MKKGLIFIAVVLLVFISSPSTYAQRSNLSGLIDQRLKSQFFCGYCHVLSYPKVIKKAHKSWEESKHKDVACVNCHYPPEEMDIAIPEHEKIPRDEETALQKKKTDIDFMKTELDVLSKLITIVNMDESVVQTKPRIDDRSCTASKCHSTTGIGKEGEFWTKKINFIESEREDKSKRTIPYVHKTHFDKTKWIEGQEIHCTTCHQKETGEKHFEVNRQKCFLCHFENTKLNEGRAKCSLCHEIPTKSLQKKAPEPGAKLITHQTIENDKVPCNSCHLQHIRGNGAVKQEKCRDCHDNEIPVMKEASNKKLMHEKHVAGQNAGCFNCHEPIEHDKKGDPIDFARNECQACHPDHHISQKILLAGQARNGVSEMPGMMFSVNTNCFGCHSDEKIVKGEKVMHGDSRTCARCHVEKTAQMVDEWKNSVNKALKEAKELEKEAEDALANAKDKAPDEKLKEAMAMFQEAQKNVQLVEAGGGVHNQKYSVDLLDVAMGNFEDLIDLLKE
jgi:hypothetical protein